MKVILTIVGLAFISSMAVSGVALSATPGPDRFTFNVISCKKDGTLIGNPEKDFSLIKTIVVQRKSAPWPHRAFKSGGCLLSFVKPKPVEPDPFYLQEIKETYESDTLEMNPQVYCKVSDEGVLSMSQEYSSTMTNSERRYFQTTKKRGNNQFEFREFLREGSAGGFSHRIVDCRVELVKVEVSEVNESDPGF